jgi:uridine kinase
MRERGRTAESVIKQYMETVRPMYERFVRPTAAFADIRLDTSEGVDFGPVERRVRELLSACGATT